MSDRLDREMNQTLHGWMREVAPVRAPGRLLEDTFGRTMATGQARALPWRRITVEPQGRVAGRAAGWLAVGVAVALVGATLFGSGLIGQPGPTVGPSPSASPSASPSPSPPGSGPPPLVVAPQATIAVQKPLALASDGRALWLLTDESKIVRIDPASNSVGASSQFGPAGDLWQGLAASADGLWITDWDTKLVYRIDPASLRVVTKIQTGLALKGVLATANAVWIADTHAGTVIRIDPKTNKVVATISVGPTGNSGPNWLASGLGSIWVDVPNNSTVVRIDPTTNRVQATIPIPTATLTPCGGFGIGTDAVWLTECASGNHVGRIDPVSNTVVARVDVGGWADATMIGGVPWISVDRGKSDNGQIVRINPATNTIDRVLVPDSGFGGGGGVVLGDSVWVADGYNNVVLRLPLSAFGP